MRYVERDGQKVLQQLWILTGHDISGHERVNCGVHKWEDVPMDINGDTDEGTYWNRQE
jgi:hypothetical protein